MDLQTGLPRKSYNFAGRPVIPQASRQKRAGKMGPLREARMITAECFKLKRSSKQTGRYGMATMLWRTDPSMVGANTNLSTQHLLSKQTGDFVGEKNRRYFVEVKFTKEARR
jgi:hypothetical protein